MTPRHKSHPFFHIFSCLKTVKIFREKMNINNLVIFGRIIFSLKGLKAQLDACFLPGWASFQRNLTRCDSQKVNGYRVLVNLNFTTYELYGSLEIGVDTVISRNRISFGCNVSSLCYMLRHGRTISHSSYNKPLGNKCRRILQSHGFSPCDVNIIKKCEFWSLLGKSLLVKTLLMRHYCLPAPKV